MKLKKESVEPLQCLVLWQFKAQDSFNALCVDKVLSPPVVGLILGGEDGVLRLHPMDGSAPSSQPKLSVETKGGPIQCLATHNVTRLGQVDLLAGDAHGTLTVVCGQQILSRQNLAPHALTCLQVNEDGRGYIEIVTSTERGLITACQTSSQLWTINLNDLVKVSRRSFVTVKCLLSVELPDTQGHLAHYLLVADDTCHLHLVWQGQVVLSLPTPGVVTAMVEGTFLAASQLTPAVTPASPAACKQVALGTATGAVHLFHNMAVTADEIARAESPMTHMAALQLADNPLDLLLCAGHFRALAVFQQGNLVQRHTTNDWINCLVTADVDGDGSKEVVFGSLDKTVTALKFTGT